MIFSVGIIGLGHIGLGYDLSSKSTYILSHTKAFIEHRGFQLLGGADPNAENRGAFERYSGLRSWESPVEMLNDVSPQVIVIATPTSTHFEMVKLALDYKPYAIVCEKPLAENLHDGQCIVSMCSDAGVLLCVNYFRRFDPAIIELKSELKDGLIGDIFKGVLWYSKGLLHNGSHYLDLLLDWFGPVNKIDILDDGPKDTLAGPEPDIVFTFSSGLRLYCLAAREENFSFIELDLIGTLGRIKYSELGAELEYWVTKSDPVFPEYTILGRIASPKPQINQYQWHVAEGLYQSLIKCSDLLSTGSNALEVLRLCKRVEMKMDSGYISKIGEEYG